MAVRTWSPALALPTIDRRLVVGALLAVISAGLVLVLTRPPTLTPVLVAGDALPAGTPLSELPISVRHVADAAGLVEGTSVGELGDWVLAIPLAEGEPVLASAVRPPATVTAPNTLALTLESQHAVGGSLSPGDLVDVYVTLDDPATIDGTGLARTSLVASDLHVIDATVMSEGMASGDVEVLVAVDDELALALTTARRSGGLDLVKVGP